MGPDPVKTLIKVILTKAGISDFRDPSSRCCWAGMTGGRDDASFFCHYRFNPVIQTLKTLEGFSL